MNWGPWLNLLFIYIFSYTVASIFIGLKFLRFRNGGKAADSLAFWLSLVFFSVAWMGSLELVANAFGYEVKPKYTLGFGVSLWIGRAGFSVAIWALALFLFWRRGRYGKKESTKETDQTAQ